MMSMLERNEEAVAASVTGGPEESDSIFRAAEGVERVPGAIPTVLMAGGYGTRLGEIARAIPKPMIPVAGRPVLEHTLEHLGAQGVRDACFSLHHLPEVIPAHFGPRRGAIRLKYSVTPHDHGTAGGAVRAASMLAGGDAVLIHSGDVLSDIDLNGMIDFHRRRRSLFTMAIARVEDAREYGLVMTDRDGRVDGFVEKPAVSPRGGARVNAGVYVIHRGVLDSIPRDRAYDFSRDLIPALMARRAPVFGFDHYGHWFDIGTPATLAAADRHLRNAE